MATLRVSEIFSDSRLTLIAVESVDFQHNKMNTGCQLYGNIEPVIVIVCGPDRTYALDMEAKLVDLGQLKQNISGLDTLTAPFAKA